jgi:hypothetical protein
MNTEAQPFKFPPGDHAEFCAWLAKKAKGADIGDAADFMEAKQRIERMAGALEFYAGIGKAVKSLWDDGKCAREALEGTGK